MMHDFLIGLSFVAMVLSPCLVALRIGEANDPREYPDYPSEDPRNPS